MDIKPNITVTLAIKLDEAEARELLVDPAPFQAEVRKQLATAHSGNGHGRNGKVARAPKVASRRGRTGGTRDSTRLPCPKCGKLLKPRGLKLHLRKRHPDYAAAAETG